MHQMLDFPLLFPFRKSWVAPAHLANRASPSHVLNQRSKELSYVTGYLICTQIN